MLGIKMISRIKLAMRLGVKPAAIAKWEKRCFPQPLERISDRLILYDTNAVERALARRTKRTSQRKPPRSVSEIRVHSTGRLARHAAVCALRR